MESNKEGKRAPFTFIWAIVNCTDLSIFNRLQSPVFAVDLMENTKWHLIIWKDNDLIVCCLHREKEDDGPSSIQLEFELSLLASDGSPLIGKKKEKKFAKGGYFIFSWFAKLDDVFLGRKAQFLPKDTLTVRCQMWRTGTEISNADLYFARTLMGMERWFFMWDVKEFSELQLGDFRTYILRPNFKGASPLTLVLSLEEGDEGNDICIAAERGFGIKSYYGISGEISLVDDQERVVHFKSVKTFSNSCNEIVFEFKQFCSRDKLMSKKDTILPNDVLSLRCEFEIDVGPVSSQVESYTHLSPSDIETNMAEMDQACFQNSDKPSTSCCPLKTALKSLYEDETLSDIILQAAGRTIQIIDLLKGLLNSPVWGYIISRIPTALSVLPPGGVVSGGSKQQCVYSMWQFPYEAP
ncbi:TD and POZ domain-containing protein 4 [Caerostris darwini]|uniref:TD and POZ domain-containing protein 4 n=1 Tax=Caerostris darwini TaxID=1538125 RepID=A0AAV4WWQ9_9ARAC|nr:TD and POZ domain-containing protein 4 [Caerostris darwini]